MLKYFIAIALLVSAGYATEVDECKYFVFQLLTMETFISYLIFPGDNAPFPDDVEIEGCDEQPCFLVRGQDVIMHMTFKARK